MYDNNGQNYSYTFEPTGEYRSQPIPVRKKKKGLGLKIAAICLACLLVGGLAGTGVGILIKDVRSVTGGGVSILPPVATSDPGVLSTAGVGDVSASPLITTQTRPGATLGASEVYEKLVNSCVGVTTPITTANIFGQTVTSATSGSGFVITQDGYLLTNYHVVQDANEQSLPVKVMTYDGSEYEAKIVGYDEDNDVALLKIDATGLTPVAIGSIEDTKVGETVYAIGNPLGELTYTFTDGIVSALDREMSTSSGVAINMFQTNVAINSGNSGGPVINAYGEVIGIASAKYASDGVEGLGFAIPIDDAMKIANDIVTYGFVRGKPYFGITVQTANSTGYGYGFGYGYGSGQQTNSVAGAQVVAVDSNSCAATAGIKVGDIITKLDDAEILNQSDLIIAKAAYTAGDSATLIVYRDGQYLTLSIVFDEQGGKAYENRGVAG